MEFFGIGNVKVCEEYFSLLPQDRKKILIFSKIFVRVFISNFLQMYCRHVY